MIIFGSRMYGKKNVSFGWGVCDHCGEYTKFKSYDGRKWGHLYYIPLIPEGPHVRVVKECKSCSTGIHIPKKEIPATIEEMETNAKNAVKALLTQQTDFNLEGEPTSATEYLMSIVDMLHCLQEPEQLQTILSVLKDKNLLLTYHLVNGINLEFLGKLDEGLSAYKEALKIDPDSILALTTLAGLQLLTNDLQGAKESFENALNISQDKFEILKMLAIIYEEMKEYQKAVDAYEKCFALNPKFRHDKAIYKEYKRVCKLAGVQPISRK